MKLQFAFYTLLLTGLFACMPQRSTTIQSPGVAPVGQSENANPWTESAETRNSNGSVRMNLPVAAFQQYAIDTDKLYYSVKYENEAGKELAARPRTKVVIDPVTLKGIVELKVPDKSSGYISMTIEEDGGQKFRGKSDKVTVDGPTKVALTLKKVTDDGQDGNIDIDVTFDDDIGGNDDSSDDSSDDSNDDAGDDDSGPDVSGIQSAELKAFVRSTGDPKDWDNPTFDQIKKVQDRFCAPCHTSTARFGDTNQQAFYQQRAVGRRLRDGSATMPTPGGPYAREMDEAAAAGFDYRAAMVRYSRSLGNNN